MLSVILDIVYDYFWVLAGEGTLVGRQTAGFTATCPVLRWKLKLKPEGCRLVKGMRGCRVKLSGVWS